MKKVIISFMFFFALFVFMRPNTIRAYAVNDLGFDTELLSSPITVDGTVIPAGSLRVTLTILNNTGYCSCGLNYHIDNTKVELIKHTTGVNAGRYVWEEGDAADQLTVYVGYDETTGIVALGIVGVDNNTSDGDIFTIYLKGKQNVDIGNENIETLLGEPTVKQLLDDDNEPLDYSIPDDFTYTVPVSFSYILGDIDGNGVVSVEDAQLLDLLVDTYGPVIATDATNTGLTYSTTTPYQGLFISINGVKTLVLSVADVNFDGVVDGTDQHLVLVYYVNVIVSGQSYSGEIGETQTKVTYVIDFP